MNIAYAVKTDLDKTLFTYPWCAKHTLTVEGSNGLKGGELKMPTAMQIIVKSAKTKILMQIFPHEDELTDLQIFSQLLHSTN